MYWICSVGLPGWGGANPGQTTIYFGLRMFINSAKKEKDQIVCCPRLTPTFTFAIINYHLFDSIYPRPKESPRHIQKVVEMLEILAFFCNFIGIFFDPFRTCSPPKIFCQNVLQECPNILLDHIHPIFGTSTAGWYHFPSHFNGLEPTFTKSYWHFIPNLDFNE